MRPIPTPRAAARRHAAAVSPIRHVVGAQAPTRKGGTSYGPMTFVLPVRLEVDKLRHVTTITTAVAASRTDLRLVCELQQLQGRHVCRSVGQLLCSYTDWKWSSSATATATTIATAALRTRCVAGARDSLAYMLLRHLLWTVRQQLAPGNELALDKLCGDCGS